MCEDEEDYALWMGGLEVLVKRAKGSHNSGREDDQESVYLRQMWQQADLDNSGTLDVHEVVKLLHVINCKVFDHQPDLVSQKHHTRASTQQERLKQGNVKMHV